LSNPTDTIIFGEKETTSDHYYQDFLEPPIGNDLTLIDQSRHMAKKTEKAAARISLLSMAARVISKPARCLRPSTSGPSLRRGGQMPLGRRQ